MKCCEIKPSDLNRKITISKLVVTPTETGGQSQSFVSFKTPWSKIKNMSGSELIRYGKLGAESISKFTIRYTAGIEESMMITYKTKEFNILHIDNLNEENRFLVITAKTGVHQ